VAYEYDYIQGDELRLMLRDRTGYRNVRDEAATLLRITPDREIASAAASMVLGSVEMRPVQSDDWSACDDG
jgi:hypothetical protein